VADERPPVFELHIRPMFRLLDRTHMVTLVNPGIDLWNLDTVWAAREEILNRLRGVGVANMPGERVGGPWPAEWIALFQRWVATGSDTVPGQHLELARPDGPYGLRKLSGGRRELKANVTPPTLGYRAWLELDEISDDLRAYTLYLEPPPTDQPGEPSVLGPIDVFPAGPTTVRVRDADGEHDLAVPP
jgi:hypothetical protein